MISIESQAKTVKLAIEEGLAKLGKTLDEVEVKILAQPGLFRKAKVLISIEGSEAVKPTPEKAEPAPEFKPFQKEEAKPFTQKKESAADGQKPFKKDEQKKDNFRNDERRDERKDLNQPKRTDGRREFDGNAGAKPKDSGKGFSHEGRKEFFKDAKNKQQPPRDESAASDRDSRSRQDEQRKTFKEKEYSPITDDAAARAGNFAEEMIKSIDPECQIVRRTENGGLYIDITSATGALIGYRGETLDSLEYLASISVNRDRDKFYKIVVDCNGYRQKREEMLSQKAKHLADKAIKTGRKVAMDPMNNFSRRVIHAALADNDKIFTRSEGTEPHRRIVIIPKRR